VTDLAVTTVETTLVIEDDGDVTALVSTDETTLLLGDTGVPGAAGPSNYPFPFFMSEDLETRPPGSSEVWIEHAGYEIEGARVSCTTAPTGADIIVDVTINDVSIWDNPADRPRILAGETDGGFVTDMDVTMLSPGDRLSVGVIQVGSLIPGRNLNVTIWTVRTNA
jgi:hypothetical protein